MCHMPYAIPVTLHRWQCATLDPLAAAQAFRPLQTSFLSAHVIRQIKIAE